MIRPGVTIEKDKSIEALTKNVFSQLDKIANPVGAKKPSISPTGLTNFSVEDALRELLEMKKKATSSNSPPPQ